MFWQGCKEVQVAAGTKLQLEDHELNLEPVHSSTFFFPFRFFISLLPPSPRRANRAKAYKR